MKRLTLDLQDSIQHRFSQVKLLQEALTHSSYANEAGKPGMDNERLEFLGDAVLELAVSQELYKRFPLVGEGDLTAMRAALVREASLAEMARKVGLSEHMLLGRGEESQGGRQRPSLLADGLEALVGAVYLDGGFEAARMVVDVLLDGRWPRAPQAGRGKDHKSRLQEMTQRSDGGRPVYVLLESAGPEHEKIFRVRVDLPDGRGFTAQGASLKKAEQSAAKKAVEELEKDASG